MAETDQELLAVLREIRDLLVPIADGYKVEFEFRQRVRTLVNTSPTRRKAWELADGTLSQRDIHKQSGMDEGNLSKYFKTLRELGAIIGDPPKRAIEV